MDAAREATRPRVSFAKGVRFAGLRGTMTAVPTLFRAVCAAVLALALGVSVPAVAEAQQGATQQQKAPRLRILVAGDSMTHGFSGDVTWRYWVGKELRRQGVRINYVGPHKGTTQGPFNQYGGRYRFRFPDSEHAATAGSRLIQRIHLGTITKKVKRYRPDVVMVMLGYNDLRLAKRPAKVVKKALTRYVRRVHRASPRTRVIVGEIYDTVHGNRTPVRLSNAAVNAHIRRLARKHRWITVARTAPGWQPTKWSTDGIHPTPTGETFLAQRFAAALHRAGVLPRRPDLFRQRKWTPRLHQRLYGGRNSLTVHFPGDRQAWTVTEFRVHYRRVGGSWRVMVPNWEKVTAGNLAPGIYEVRTVAKRYWMSGVPVVGKVRVG